MRDLMETDLGVLSEQDYETLRPERSSQRELRHVGRTILCG